MAATPDAIRALDALSDAEWMELYLRMVRYAQRALENSRARQTKGLKFVMGLEAEDFVGAALEGLYTGRRTYDPTKESVATAFRDAVISELSNTLTKRENQIISLPATYDPGSAPPDEGEILMHDILRIVDATPDLREIVILIHDGIDAPREIARTLNVGVSDIMNRKKRLRRLLGHQGYDFGACL